MATSKIKTNNWKYLSTVSVGQTLSDLPSDWTELLCLSTGESRPRLEAICPRVAAPVERLYSGYYGNSGWNGYMQIDYTDTSVTFYAQQKEGSAVSGATILVYYR